MYPFGSQGGESATSGVSSSKWWKIRGRNIMRISDMRSNGPGASISRDFNTSDHQLHPPESNEYQEHSYKQLQNLIQRIQPASSSASQVDSAYKEFDKHKETCSSLCASILQDDGRPLKFICRTAEVMNHRGSDFDCLNSPGSAMFDQMSSFSGHSSNELVNTSLPCKGLVNEMYLNAIRHWRACLEGLCDALRTSLGDTYKSYERDATPEMVDLLFMSRKFRREAVHRMRNASVTRVLSADPQFFPRYEIRFRNYERVKKEVTEVRQLLQSGESGILPSREIQEFVLSQRGDAILEFANIGDDASQSDPVLRFRVSSYNLAEASPIFARMFSGSSSSLQVHEAEDITAHLPPPPTPYVCKDGTEIKLYRMPQYETNRHQSLEILLHAAHMHDDFVPQDVSFEQLVSIAECSIRYKSTSPLELILEHKWLPQWMRQGVDDMQDGLLVISYAFGLRQLFTRISKRVILNLIDENDLRSKPWPEKIRDKIWAVRCAKMDQIYSCCINAIQEYLRPPVRNSISLNHHCPTTEIMTTVQTQMAPSAYPTALTSCPRCPKGSHSCDAANLGWMMLIFNQTNLLHSILQPAVTTHMPHFDQLSRSLAQMVEMLSTTPSPASPIHRGSICDASLPFRAAIADIFNSVTGLTLHDISGKSHGWGLSKHLVNEPDSTPIPMAGRDDYTVATEFSDSVRLGIFTKIDNLSDLQAMAQANRSFLETYKTHKVRLLRRFLQTEDSTRRSSNDNTLHRGANTEPKMLTKDFEKMINQPIDSREIDSVISLATNDDGYDVDDDEDDEDLTDAPKTPLSGSVHSDRQPAIDPPGYPTDEALALGDEALSTASRQAAIVHAQTLSSKSHDAVTFRVKEPRMTEGEAHRNLWPDAGTPGPLAPITLTSPGVGLEGHREKFLAGDPLFTAGLEDKTLVVTGDKQLRSKLDGLKDRATLKKGI